MSLLSPVVWIVLGVAALIALLLTALVSGRRGVGWKVLLAVLLILTIFLSIFTLGAKANAKMAWVKSSDELVGLINEEKTGHGHSSLDGSGDPTPQSAPEVKKVDPNAPLTPETKLPDEVAAHSGDPSYTVDFADQGNNEWIGQFHGPQSNIETEVSVWLPPGYSKDSKNVYDVSVFLHGFPGSNRGVIEALELNKNVAPMIQAGQLRPTIVVVADTSAGGREPDCIDMSGLPLSETLNTRDLVSMVRSTFPNVSDERGHWTISGISAGAYCSPVMEIRHPDVFWGAISLGGYDNPQMGGLLTLPEEERAAFNVSTMLAQQDRAPADIYIAGTAGDPDSVSFAEAVKPNIRPTDNIVTQIDGGGGHSWTVWAGQLPAALKWWHDSTGGVKKPAADTAQSAADDEGAAEEAEPEEEPSGPVVDFLKQEDGTWSMRGNGALAAMGILAALGLIGLFAAGPHLTGYGAGGAVLYVFRVVLAAVAVIGLTMVAILIFNNSEAFFASWWDLWENRKMFI